MRAFAILALCHVALAQNSCMTVDNQPCIFPFTTRTYLGERIFTSCSTARGESTPFCATSVDDTGRLVTKGACNADCPGMTPRPMPYINPLNNVGQCFCGVPNSQDASRIVGGTETTIGEVPWQVAILYGVPPTSGRQGCGGTLVGDRHVITAAHCTDGQDPSSMSVLIGDTTLAVNDDTQSFIKGIQEVRQHEAYRFPRNDIAVIVLDSPVDLKAYPHIKPACLPTASSPIDSFYGEKAIVSGWGRVEEGGRLNSHLHEINVEVFSPQNCGLHNSYLEVDMVCAGVMAGGKGTCQGDSGGPLVIPDPMNNNATTLIGVVSWGTICGGPERPGGYASVPYFVGTGWLASALSDVNTCPPAEENPPPVTIATTPATTEVPTTTPPAACNSTPNSLPKLQMFKQVKKVKTIDDCRALCQDEMPKCKSFAWFKHSKVNKRRCQLFTVIFRKKKNWYTEPFNC